jgi:NAD(P)-dependent dehydrogenase (short-subunit alcohol dehydrogenase family)
VGRTLTGKVAVVTGAAAGIGRATAHHLGELGARVAVTDSDSAGAERVAEEMVLAGRDAIGLTCEVSDRDSIETMVRDTVDHYGGVDLLDHNAAWTSFRRDTDAVGIDLETWDRVLRTNSTGALILTKAVVPHMRARGGGAIVFISSGSAAIGEHGRVAYGVSKAAIEQLTRHVASHYARTGSAATPWLPGSSPPTPPSEASPSTIASSWPVRTRWAASARRTTSPTSWGSCCPDMPASSTARWCGWTAVSRSPPAFRGTPPSTPLSSGARMPVATRPLVLRRRPRSCGRGPAPGR